MSVMGWKRSVGENREFQHRSLCGKPPFAALRRSKCAGARSDMFPNGYILREFGWYRGVMTLSDTRPKAFWGGFFVV